MSEQEEKKESVGTSEGQSLTPHGETLPKATNRAEDGNSAHSREPIREEERATVRFRSRTVHLRTVGIAIAILALSVALILCCVAGVNGWGEPDETTAETTAPEGDETNDVRDLYEFDPAIVPEGHIAFRPMDLSGGASDARNESERTFDLAALLSRYGEAEDGSALTFTEPLVLILHAHTTEGYSASGALSWDGEGELARSDSKTENVVAVGKVLAEALNAAGIPTLHCDVFHDLDENGVGTYNGAYDRVRETVEAYLEEHPSIKYVIDLHRDAVLDGDGNIIRAVTETDGKATAQVMAVVGSGEDFDWESNLALALALTESLNKDSASLCRAPVLKSSSFGQELAPHSLILEIGTAANSLEEATNAARLIAPTLAKLIRATEAGESAS